MAEASQTTQDSAGITRTSSGEIVSPSLTSTQTSTTKDDGSAKDSTQDKTGAKTDAQASTTSTPDSKDKTLLDATAKDEPKVGAPEAYTDFKAPEGYELDKDTVAKAAPLFKELGLNQDQAQKMVDLYVTLSKDAADAPMKFAEEKRQEARSLVIKDPEVGNGVDGIKKDVHVSISKAIDMLPDGGRAFREAMNYTGAGDQLAFVKGLAYWAKLVTEGSHVAAGGPSKFGQSAPNRPTGPGAASMYPHLPSASGG